LRPQAVVVAVCLLAVSIGACGFNSKRNQQSLVESGDRYFGTGRYNEAIVEYRSAIQLNPRFASAHSRLAAAYAKAGRAEDALAEYVRAADSQPDDLSLQLIAGNALLAARRFDDARGRANTILGVAPKNADALILLGNSLAHLDDSQHAIAKIEEAIELDPTKSAGYMSLAVIEAEQGKSVEAEAMFRRAVDLEPSSNRAHLMLGNYLWSAGRLAEAESSLRHAVELAPQDPLANRALAALCLATHRTAEAERYLKTVARNDNTSRFVLADYYIATQRPQEAVVELEPLRADTTLAREATRRLARAYADLGERAKAEALVNDLLKQEPSNPETLLIKGQLLMLAGKKEEALEQVKAAAQADPDSARVQFTLGKILSALGDITAAEHAFTRVLELNPKGVAAQLELSSLQMLKGSPRTSVKLAQDVVKTMPENPEARTVLARALLANGDIAGAEAEIANLNRAQPESAAVFTLQGKLALLKKDPVAARRAFDRVMELDPDSLEALGALVDLDVGEGRAGEAVTRVDRRLKASPPRAELFLLAGYVASASGDLPAAEKHLRRAIELDPSTLKAYVVLAQLYIRQQRVAEAIVEFDALAKRQSHPAAAMTMAAMLQQAQGKVADAQDRFERILLVDPNAAIASNNLAWIYAEAGTNLDTALQLAQSAANSLPHSADAQDTLGWVRYKKHQPASAVEAFEKSIQMDPQNPLYRQHLALAQREAKESK
jgi:putative PEP-CTERM system TPR-repeat lipoprotein